MGVPQDKGPPNWWFSLWGPFRTTSHGHPQRKNTPKCKSAKPIEKTVPSRGISSGEILPIKCSRIPVHFLPRPTVAPHPKPQCPNLASFSHCNGVPRSRLQKQSEVSAKWLRLLRWSVGVCDLRPGWRQTSSLPRLWAFALLAPSGYVPKYVDRHRSFPCEPQRIVVP